MPDLIITVNDVTTIHDETAGLQNTPPNLDPTTDENGNDIAVASLPTDFSDRLIELMADPSGAIGAALSGYDGMNNGENVFNVTSDAVPPSIIDNLAFTDTNGDPLNGFDSGLTTTDGGNTIFLYTDTNDNIVLGREGTGTTADPLGAIVLAIYLDQSAEDGTASSVDGKIWTVQYEAIFHNVPGDGTTPEGSYDEPLDLTNDLFVTASRDLDFDLNNAPSGQNLFIMFGDGDISADPGEVGIVATGKFPANESEGESINTGNTVNTSQAGGPTTFGIDNQMLTASAVPGEGDGIYFTFVTGPNPDFTVPNLTQTEADVEANIQFNDFLDAKAAEFQVVQLQGGKTADVKVTAYNETQTAANASGMNFVDELNDLNDLEVPITSAVVVDFDGGGELNGTDNGDGTFTILPDLGDNFVTITGVEAGDTITYFTDGDHNRVLIENAGDGRGQDSANFDIGGFKLIQADTTTAQVGSTVHWEDDGPAIDIDLSGAELRTDDRSLTGGSGLPDAGTNTDTDTLTTVVGANTTAGADGQESLVYTLGVKSAGEDSGVDDVATGNGIFLSLESGVVVGRVGSDEVTPDPAGDIAFQISVDGTSGAVTLDQSRAIEHGTAETNAGAPDYYTTDVETLIADSVTLTATLTDGDVDKATDTENIGDKIGFTDDGPQIDIDLSGAELRTDDRSLTGGSGLPDAGTNTDTDTLTTVVGANTTAGADGQESLVYTLGVKSAGEDSGVDDVATGNGIFLSLESGVVVGRVGSDEVTPDPAGDIAFQISVDGTSGAVTLDQSRAIEHGTAETNAGAPDYYTTDVETLIADSVTLTATLTDGDVDKATDTENIGDKIGFTDDGPQIDIDLSGAELRTDDRSLTGGSGLPDAGTNTDTDTLTTVVGANTTAGADGQESLVYTLGVKSAGEDSGVDDVATGNGIFLSLESGVVVGRVGSDEVTPDPAGDIAFQISVDGTSGAVTLDQSRAIEHGTAETNAGAPDYYTTDVETLIADSVTLTATLTDGDVDKATDTENIGDKIGFTDDGPQIDIDLSGAELRTDDRSLTGGSGLPDAGTNTDTDTLTTVVGANTTAGADGQESLVYTLGVKSAGEDSGVDDVATGNGIFLSLESGVVVGRVGSDEVTPDPAGDIAFQISVDGTSGAVTLDQSRAIEHGTAETNAGAPDYYTTDVETLIADSVTLTATLTDGDVDKATDTENIGDKIGFTDDGPQIDIELSGAELRTDDRSLTGGSGLPDAGTNTDTDTLTTVVGANTTAGADGQESLVYTLGVKSAGEDSGVDDVATGNGIFLYLESGVVVGRVGSDEVTPNPAGDIAFQISVDGTSGAVTLDQSRAIEHGTAETNAGAPDYYTTDVETLIADSVTLTATLTDGDVDKATDTENIGDKIGFTDDGPQIDIDLSGAELRTDDRSLTGGSGLPDAGTNTDTDTLTTVVGANTTAGADGQESLVYTLGVKSAGEDSGVDDVATGNGIFLYLESGVVVGRVGSDEVTPNPAGDIAFQISVDGTSGAVTLDQSRAIEHGTAETNAGAPDYYTTDVETLIADSVTLTATLTDGDVDKATDTENIGDKIGFTDDGPDVDFSNLVGMVTTTPQIGFWDETTGADQPGTLTVTASNTFQMVTPDGITSTGTVGFDGTTGTGTLTADFDNDPGNGDESIGFSLAVNQDGTYVFDLDEVIVPVVTLSTDEGQLPAGGPDPVQTLSFVGGPDFVFFAVDASTASVASDPFDPTDIGTPIPLTIPPAAGSPNSPIGLGEPDLTEAELQALSAMVNIEGTGVDGTGDFPFIRDEIEMNVSTSGIGVGNNVLQGEDLPGDTAGTINPFGSGAFDESFVINPEPLASEVKVFVSKTAGGFEPPGSGATPAKTDYLYWNLYDELGNNSGPNLVEFADVFDEAGPGGTGENLWSFTVDIDDVTIDGDFIDAMQFTMGFGNIKIPKIEVVVRGDTPPNDIFLDFNATLTDADGDSATTAFAVDLVGNDVDPDVPDLPDYTLVDSEVRSGVTDDTADAFDVDVAQSQDSYLVQGFDPDPNDDPGDDELYDQLYLLNGSNGFTLNTGSDLGVGDPGVNDSQVLVDGVTVIVEDATLRDIDITEADTALIA